MKYLKKTFRWFGPSFGVSLEDIKQVGVEGIVAACQEVPLGEIWPMETISALKTEIENYNLEWSVVESVNVHTSIKYGLPDRDKYITNYIQTLKNLAANDIKVVCYNFMQLIDWTRTNLDFQLSNGASALKYDPIAAAAFDLFILKREHAVMPGSRKLISITEFKRNHASVLGINKTQLQDNLAYFLRAIIPEAEKVGVKMAIHPDDPPFSVFGVPRIVSNYEELKFILDAVPSPSNGLTFCSGSLGASDDNDLLKIINDFGERIHFIHLRNVERNTDGSFYEADHLNGSLPMGNIMKALIMEQRKRTDSGVGIINIPMRPDHGHVLLDDKKRQSAFYSGYSMVGRALGLAQLTGLEKGLRLGMDL